MRTLVFTQYKGKKSDNELLKDEAKSLNAALAKQDSISVPTIKSEARRIPDMISVPSAEQLARLGPINEQSASNKLNK